MAAGGEIPGHGRRAARFQRQLEVRRDVPARRIRGRLGVLAVVEDPRHHLHVALMLHVAAHDAEAHGWRAVAQNEAGDDGVVGALVRPDGIGVVGIEHEAGAAVLQGNAGARHDDAGAEAHVVRLDQRHHDAVLIRSRQIDRVAARGQRHRRQSGRAAADARRGPLDRAGRQEFLRRGAHGAWIGEVVEGGADGDLHGLDLQMRPFRAPRRQSRQIEVRQDGQRDLRGEPLAVGRCFDHVHVPVGLADGAHPVRLVGGEIVDAQGAASGPRGGVHALGKIAPVERLAVGFGDPFEGPSQVGIGEQLARRRRPTVGKEVRLEIGERGVPVARPRPGGRCFVADVEAAAGVADGGFEQLGERQPAESTRQRHPGAHRAGHRHRVPAQAWHGVAVREPRRRPCRRRAARGVQRSQLVPIPENGEGVAADAVAARLHHRQRDGRRHRRVHRAAAAAEHLQTGAGGQRLRGRHDVARQHGRSAGRVGEGEVEHGCRSLCGRSAVYGARRRWRSGSACRPIWPGRTRPDESAAARGGLRGLVYRLINKLTH